MSVKEVKFGQECRDLQLQGVNIVANAVKVTLGPRGKNVVIEKSYGDPVITKDGATVAKDIALGCKFQNVGAQLMRQVSAKTAEEAGDGTTTSTILAQAILQKGMKGVAAGLSAVQIKKGLDQACNTALMHLRDMSVPCEDSSAIQQVATVSANDAELGKIIAEAIAKVGKTGVISVNEGHGFKDEIEIVEGLQFDKGYISPYFVANATSTSIEFDDPYILVTDHKINSMRSLIPILESVSKSNKSLLIIADNVEGEALNGLVFNNMRGVVKVVAVKAPGFGDNRKDMLEDLAVLTGTKLMSSDMGIDLESVQLSDLGQAQKIKVKKDTTTIIGFSDRKDALVERINYIHEQISQLESKDKYATEKLKERLAKLSGGVALIRVGAPTELEMKEKKDRIEDAIHATRAAIDSGIVPGGGTALLHCISAIKDQAQDQCQELRFGVTLLAEALEAPARQILINAGHKPDVILEQMRLEENTGLGYDAQEGKFCNLIEKGIIDPTKVSITALRNAVSIAGLLLTTEAIIASQGERETTDPSKMMH